MDVIFFRTLAPKNPWLQSGLQILQRSIVVVYNPESKILAAQPIQEGMSDQLCHDIGPAALGIVDDPCKVFDFIGIEARAGRLLECALLNSDADEEV